MSTKLALLIIAASSAFSTKLTCPPLKPSRQGTITCFSGNKTVSCESTPTSLQLRCHEFYQLQGDGFVSCLPNGSWSSAPPKCIPDCGRQNPGVALIVNGVLVPPGRFPWHVAIYNFIDGEFTFWCGGSLVSEYSVITAAHCTWNVSPGNLTFAFGKSRLEFTLDDESVQKRKARKIEILPSYQDAAGNYNGDISIVFLEKAVVLNQFVRPVCVDWDQRFSDKHLVEGNLGVDPFRHPMECLTQGLPKAPQGDVSKTKVLGWGLTENDTFSDLLRMLELPVVSDEKCIAEQQRDFKKFVTYTSFCAGFKNGTGVCNGDSGGGLAFFDKESNRWYLQGIVSVSPRRSGTPFCDPKFYTVFTKVGAFLKWLEATKRFEREVEKMEEEVGKEEVNRTKKKEAIKGWRVGIGKDFYNFIKKHFTTEEFEVNGKKIVFPHSKKILEPLMKVKDGSGREIA